MLRREHIVRLKQSKMFGIPTLWPSGIKEDKPLMMTTGDYRRRSYGGAPCPSFGSTFWCLNVILRDVFHT